jgi:O-antigen/teichoic acid export membrane protein
LNIKKELFRGSVTVSILTFIGHILSTVLKVTLSRLFGIQIFGIFSLIMVFSRFFATVISLGYNQSIVYFISKYKVRNEWGKISKVFNKGLYGITLSSLLMVIILIACKTYFMKYFFPDNEYNIIIFIVAIMIIIATNNYISAVLIGLKKVREQTIIFTSLYPAIMILSLFLTIYQTNSESFEIFLFFGISINVIALLTILVITKFNVNKKVVSKKENYSIKLSQYSVPIWVSTLLRSAIGKADRIMLGFLMPVDQVGVYNAGLTLSILFAFPLRSLKPILDPLIVERYINNDFKSLNILFNTMIRWTSLFVIPTFGFIICFGVNIIQLFGRDFASGYAVMLVLSVSQMVSTVFGVANSFLNMADRPKSNMKINVFGALITVFFNMLLIPKWGGLGAAIGTSISLIIINLLRINTVTKHFRIILDPSIILNLFIKFLPLTLVCLKLIVWNILTWIYIAFGYLFISCAIIYLMLNKSERSAIRSLLEYKN